MKKYYIAVDGGGSKTAFCVMDLDVGILPTLYAGTSNYKITETDGGRDTILDGFEALFTRYAIRPQEVRGLVMGMSGCDSPEDFAHYLDIALETGIPRERLYLCNDSELAFYAGGNPPGLCIIAGTGSVSTGIAADGAKARSGGWGSPISDEGSGAWMGTRALAAALRYADGYEPYQDIFDALRAHFQVGSFEELPKRLSQIGIPEIAASAKVVMALADADESPFATALVGQAGEKVAQIAASVYRKLRFEREEQADVVMAGSLFKSSAFHRAFQEAFLNILPRQNVNFLREVKSPVLGGIALARRMFPADSD